MHTFEASTLQAISTLPSCSNAIDCTPAKPPGVVARIALAISFPSCKSWQSIVTLQLVMYGIAPTPVQPYLCEGGEPRSHPTLLKSISYAPWYQLTAFRLSTSPLTKGWSAWPNKKTEVSFILPTICFPRFRAISPHSARDTLVVMVWIGIRSTDPSRGWPPLCFPRFISL